MKVLLTGSTGLVGSMIQIKLQDSVELYAVGRDGLTDMENQRRFFKLDLRDGNRFKQLLTQLQPDVVVHCAAQIPSKLYPDSAELAAINARIDESVFSGVSERPCKLLYISSTFVYGHPNFELNIDETFPVNESSYYASQKIKSERFITQNFENGLILRLNAPYGLNMRNDTVMTMFIKLALRDEPILLHGSGNRMQDFTNTRDIAELISNLITSEKRQYGIFNISAGMPITMVELANKIIRISGSKSKIINSGRLDEQENYKASYSIDKAKRLLNWKPKITIEDGIKDLILNSQLN